MLKIGKIKTDPRASPLDYCQSSNKSIFHTGKNMRFLTALIMMTFASSFIAKAQSNLLESVKRNPKEAMELCSKFKNLNARGISANSKETITDIARKRNLSEIDAEILSIYVIGLHCPEIK